MKGYLLEFECGQPHLAPRLCWAVTEGWAVFCMKATRLFFQRAMLDLRQAWLHCRCTVTAWHSIDLQQACRGNKRRTLRSGLQFFESCVFTNLWSTVPQCAVWHSARASCLCPMTIFVCRCSKARAGNCKLAHPLSTVPVVLNPHCQCVVFFSTLTQSLPLQTTMSCTDHTQNAMGMRCSAAARATCLGTAWLST
jgi:hypothetical protein